MKNILGFDSDTIIVHCEECGCIFTIDSDEDVGDWLINNRQKSYVECPNCKSIRTKCLVFDE